MSDTSAKKVCYSRGTHPNSLKNLKPKTAEYLRLHPIHLGKKHSDESKKLISKNRRGKAQNERNSLWKGDNVGYIALHAWVARKLGRPKECALCKDTSIHRYHWASISRSCKRDLSDWIRLCPKCHRNYDKTIPGTIRRIFLTIDEFKQRFI